MFPEVIFPICYTAALALSWKCFRVMKRTGVDLSLLGRGSVVRATVFIIVSFLGLALQVLILTIGEQLESWPLWKTIALKAARYVMLLYFAEYVIYEGALIVSALLFSRRCADLPSALLKAKEEYSRARVSLFVAMGMAFVALTLFCSPFFDIVLLLLQRSVGGDWR